MGSCVTTGELMGTMPSLPRWERLRAWLKLCAGVGVILLVMFWLGPLLLQLPWYDEMSRFIDAEGIRSTAINYTDLETFSSAEFALRQNMVYGPSAPHTP